MIHNRFSNAEHGVSHAISNTRRQGCELSPQQLTSLAFVDHVLSYNINCGYSIYCLDHFEQYFTITFHMESMWN